MGTIDIETISLRPMSLRPGAGGGSNPFASFGKGAGVNLKSKAASAEAQAEKKKARGEVVKYTREYLMKFAEVYTRMPSELQIGNLDIVLDPNDPDREAQRKMIQQAAAEDAEDERDWRARVPLPPAPSSDKAAEENAKLQRTEHAWHGGTSVEGTQQILRKIKGILNKLTPEKFERLLSQLIPMVSSFDVLQGTIQQVFENAVQQPTFVPMYADLCSELDAALPDFEVPDTNGPQNFKKMLANTCQEEYMAAGEARAAALGFSGAEREEAERQAKQRLIGIIRLIAELYKKGMVNDRIIMLILSDLLGPSDGEPTEENLEAACEVLSIAGANLEAESRAKAKMEAAFAQMTKLSNSKSYPPRVRFVVKDLLDLRAQHWVARRETYTAKKLEEIRSEAQAELGIVDVAIPGLDSLPGLVPGLQSNRAEEVELFPAFRGADLGSKQAAGGDGKYSAFLGEYVPMPEVTPPEAPGQAPRAPRTDLTSEERASLAKSLFSDYIVSPNLEEATAAAQELAVPGFLKVLVTIGAEKALDCLDLKEQNACIEVIAKLTANGTIPANSLRDGVAELSSELEDLALDMPAAPRVLGRMLGLGVASGAFGLDVLAAQAGTVESAEPRRAFVAEALRAVQEDGDDKLVKACKEAAFDAGKALEFDPEFDGDLPSAAVFLKEQGLGVVPV